MTGDDALRERLLELRQSLLDAMYRDGPEPSWLAMMAGIMATLAALDDEAERNR
jgi:hypothetical protein